MVIEWDPGFVGRFRDGAADVLETIYRAHVEQVIRTVRAVLRACAVGMGGWTPELAVEVSDVAQDTFAKAFAPETRRRFDCGRPFGPYLVQIARNVAIDHWRARRRQVPMDVDQLLAELAVNADRNAAPDDDWAASATLAVVERYLVSLDAEERRVHEALYVRGLSQREAAAALGIGRQVLRTVEGKLRAGLRRELRRAGCLETEEVPLAVRVANGARV
jgi:RNA polymerase sigma-70 factor (ECF subfamily)